MDYMKKEDICMKRYSRLYTLGLLCAVQCTHVLQAVRSVSAAEEYYNQAQIYLTQRMTCATKSEPLRQELLNTVHTIMRADTQGSESYDNPIEKIRRACTPSKRHLKKLIRCLKPCFALNNHSGVIIYKKNNTRSWAEAYDNAKVTALIPLMIYRKMQRLSNYADPAKAVDMLLATLNIFDGNAHDALQAVHNERAKLINSHRERLISPPWKITNAHLNQELSTIAQLLQSAQAQAQKMREALQPMQTQKIEANNAGYALFASICIAGLYAACDIAWHMQKAENEKENIR